jgi:hypothetical protein
MEFINTELMQWRIAELQFQVPLDGDTLPESLATSAGQHREQ